MSLDPMTSTKLTGRTDAVLRRLLAAMSVFTMVMTIPQVYTIWVNHHASGVSMLSWSAYLFSAVLWFVHGLRTGDKNIYLPCVGWVVLDAAVIAGVAIYG